MGRGEEEGCWAGANGVSTRTARKIARRDTSLIRKDPSDWFLNAWSKRRSLSQPRRIDGAEDQRGAARGARARKLDAAQRGHKRRRKNFCSNAFCCCMQERVL